MRVKEQTLCIIGGASGIGKGIIERYLKEGGRVALFDSDAKALTKIQKLALGKGKGDYLYTKVCESGDLDTLESSIAQCGEYFEGIDSLVCCSELFFAEPLENQNIQNAMRLVASDILTPLCAAKAALPFMKRSRNASIVYISDICAHRGFANLGALSAAKGGLVSLARSQSIELASLGIRVNTISIGATESPALHYEASLQSKSPKEYIKELSARYPNGKLNKIEDIAATAMFLFSKEGSRISGQDIIVDGGITAAAI